MVDIVRKTSSMNDPLHVGFIRTYSIDGKEVYSAKCIGHKRIIKLNGARGKKLTLDITESAGEPVIRDMGVY